ncbi:hypothetical protein AVEN_173959-1 [Araneus ventricosus]|uniref:Uncharacterized protein n=1 Tax=Araneus ventricosus TaxID=182803 RepID=A0A4Y2FX98_ARAVE|nr:hypothetical protein AVEN_223247-1 [Araneus ventricosus]GBM45126.1 hypothetical protein AVEN_21053-1 [Araneus ventricosus]GBM45205.1 hypothetical protein AVEN_58369-1 [Araneus ventricosus]GBM45338.1 hypothetical protein AVEN_173959-1 [Araneus ventricosus]
MAQDLSLAPLKQTERLSDANILLIIGHSSRHEEITGNLCHDNSQRYPLSYLRRGKETHPKGKRRFSSKYLACESGQMILWKDIDWIFLYTLRCGCNNSGIWQIFKEPSPEIKGGAFPKNKEELSSVIKGNFFCPLYLINGLFMYVLPKFCKKFRFPCLQCISMVFIFLFAIDCSEILFKKN